MQPVTSTHRPAEAHQWQNHPTDESHSVKIRVGLGKCWGFALLHYPKHPNPKRARRPARRTWTWRLASAMAAVSAGTVSGRLRAISSDATRVSVLSSVSAPVLTCNTSAQNELEARSNYPISTYKAIPCRTRSRRADQPAPPL